MRGGFLGVLVAAALFPGAQARALDLRERPLDVAAWPGMGTVNGVAQSGDGFVWLATSGGLRRFDGLRFTEVDLGPGAGHRQCRRVLAGRDGAIWVASGGGILRPSADGKGLGADRVGPAGLVRLADGGARAFSARDGLPSDWTWGLVEDAAGTLWAGTENGLVRYRDGRFAPPDARGRLPSPFVSALHAAPDGTLWVGTAAGLVALRAGAFHVTPITEPVLAVTIDQRGRVVAAIPGHLALFDGDRVERIPTGETFAALLSDRDGNLWTGMLSQLGRFNGVRVVPDPDPALARRPAIALAEDREGGVWVGTQAAGVLRLAQPIVRNLGGETGAGFTAFAVLAARDGSVWATTTRGLSQFVGNQIREIASGPELGFGSRALAQAPDGAIWVADLGTGLVRVQPGTDHAPPRLTRYGPDEGLTSRHTMGIAWDARGDLWVTWRDGGATRFPAGDLARGQTIAAGSGGTCAGGPWFVRAGRGAAMWLGGTGGLSRLAIAGDQITAACFKLDGATPGPEIMDVVEDSAGSVWVATLGDTGLAQLVDRRIVPLPVLPGMLGGHVFGLVADAAGHLWATTNHGVFRARTDDLRALAQHRRGDLPAVEWNGETGMSSQECTAGFQPKAALGPDGHLWVPTLQGVSVVLGGARGLESRRRPVADPVIEELRVDGQAIALAGGPRLPEGRHHLELTFTAPTFVAPARLRFAYRMLGLDTDWSVAALARSARYANLGAGRYQFEARAIDEGGVAIGRTAALAFVIPPRLHQRPVFWLGVALLAAALVLAAHRLRLRQLAARYAAVEEERTRLARDLHDGLAQGFTAMGFILDSVRLSLPDTVAEQRSAVGQVRDLLDRAQEESRRAIWSLRAEVVGRKSLQEIVEAVVKAAVVPAGTRVSFEFTGARLRAAPMVEHELPHIVQEAMTNALRHGRAKQITVALHHLPSALRLSVRDDGIGMAPQTDRLASGGGFGIVGMRERAMRIGGTLQMGPGPDGKGTEVTLVVNCEGST